MERAGYAWSEHISPGGQEQTSTSVAPDSMSKTMTITVNWGDVREAIKHIIGFAQVSGAQNFFSLHRQTPAKHPMFPWLRASKILSINGRLGSRSQTWGQVLDPGTGFNTVARPTMPRVTPATPGDINSQTQGQTGISSGDYGIYGYWDQALITILFEAPKYPILEDGQVQAEYQRYVIKKYDTNLESLARKGEIWQWVNLNIGRSLPGGFPGDLLLKQAKGILTWTWVDVPEDYILLGKLIPTNFLRVTGTVNLIPFPKLAYPNQNSPLNPDDTPNLVQFIPGTLLMLPIKTEPRSQINPNILLPANRIDPTVFPRTYDVTFTMVHFDPQPNGESLVEFLAPGSGAVALPQVGGAFNPLIQGHNLVPTPVALPLVFPVGNRTRWWAAGRSVRDVNADIVAPTSPVPDQNLLYQYQDFEQPWKCAV